jgi:hypothetical protein
MRGDRSNTLAKLFFAPTTKATMSERGSIALTQLRSEHFLEPAAQREAAYLTAGEVFTCWLQMLATGSQKLSGLTSTRSRVKLPMKA